MWTHEQLLNYLREGDLPHSTKKDGRHLWKLSMRAMRVADPDITETLTEVSRWGINIAVHGDELYVMHKDKLERRFPATKPRVLAEDSVELIYLREKFAVIHTPRVESVQPSNERPMPSIVRWMRRIQSQIDQVQAGLEHVEALGKRDTPDDDLREEVRNLRQRLDAYDQVFDDY